MQKNAYHQIVVPMYAAYGLLLIGLLELLLLGLFIGSEVDKRLPPGLLECPRFPGDTAVDSACDLNTQCSGEGGGEQRGLEALVWL